MATICFKCGDEIQGDRYENAVQIIEGTINQLLFEVSQTIHFACVDDPTHLRPDQFQKWAAYQISLLAKTQSSQVHVHNDLVDALEEIHPGTRAAYEQIVQRGLHEIVSQETDPR